MHAFLFLSGKIKISLYSWNEWKDNFKALSQSYINSSIFHLSNLDHLDILKNIIPISYSEDIILIKPDGQEGTKHSKDLAITKEVNTDALGPLILASFYRGPLVCEMTGHLLSNTNYYNSHFSSSKEKLTLSRLLQLLEAHISPWKHC
jgi:hypothetical protein